MPDSAESRSSGAAFEFYLCLIIFRLFETSVTLFPTPPPLLHRETASSVLGLPASFGNQRGEVLISPSLSHHQARPTRDQAGWSGDSQRFPPECRGTWSPPFFSGTGPNPLANPS
ncbi:hypothetical protein RRG08_030145 [Elysia crispata]|uniref:Uncharacterized protein n=1 Tax=Elysia crispata TaxID=231223 RepID=A0AAE0ZRM3_9GAST|nr:hypothetical protein RRG08_030145 [Elysia crispata]